MQDTSRLLAIEEIKQLKARYFRAVDTKDAALFRSTLTEDTVLDYRGAATDPVSGINAVPSSTQAPIEGADAATESIMAAVAPLVSVHHGCMPEITILSETRAEGLWAMVDRLRPTEPGPFEEMIGWGHYHETYEKVGGDWKIKTLRLTRLRVDIR